MYDNPDYQEALAERNFARRRLQHQIMHYDPRDPDYLPDEEEDDDEQI